MPLLSSATAVVVLLLLLQYNIPLSSAFFVSHHHQGHHGQTTFSPSSSPIKIDPIHIIFDTKRRCNSPYHYGVVVRSRRPRVELFASQEDDDQSVQVIHDIEDENRTALSYNDDDPNNNNNKKRRHPRDHLTNLTYNFWEDALSVASFNMDLENLAQEDPQKAADALEIMEAMYHKEPENDYYVKPNAACYTTVIDGWVRFQALPSSTIVATTKTTTSTAATEDDDTVSSNLHRYQHLQQHPYNSQNNHHHYGAQKAQAWLDRLEAAYRATGDPDFKPNTVSYMLVCQKWADDYAQDFTGESAEKAEQILVKMRRLEAETDANNAHDATTTENSYSRGLDVKLWSIVLDAWCKRAGKVRGAIKRAEKLLSEMERKASEQEQQELLLLANMGENSSNLRGSIVRPNIVTYTSFIGGLARSSERNKCQMAEEVLKRMKHFGGIEADMVAYTAVLNCYAKATSRKERSMAAKRALEILDFLETQYSQEEKYYLKPNVITYGTAIKAIGNSLDERSADLAEKVLRRMYSLHETKTIASVKPQTSTYNAVISACAGHSRRILGGQGQQTRSSAHSIDQQKIGLKNARRAELLLVEMSRKASKGETDVAPNVRTWGSVISAWAESGQSDAGEQADRVLKSMERMYAQGKSDVRPNFVCYTTAMAALGKSALPNTNPRAAERNIAAADKVEGMLLKMETEYETSMDVDKRPNTITYITAIDSFCKLDEMNAATRSQNTVDRMMRLYAKGLGHVRPSRIVFNSLINAWSRCPNKSISPATMAEKIFLWMEKQYKEAGDYIVKPDEVSLCGVLNAWANNAENGGARRAQKILDKIDTLSTKERGFQHTTICHNIVIKAWGRSKEPDAVQQAEAILTRLEDMWSEKKDDMLKPDVTTYSSVINCCAYCSGAGRYNTGESSSRSVVADDLNSDSNNDAGVVVVRDGRNEAFQVALRTFRKLCASTSARPNNITYGTLFKAIANLTPMNEEREKLIRSIFAQCCKEGQVDAFVLSQVRNASPTSLYRELVLEPCGLNNTPDYSEGIEVVLRNLPTKWLRRYN